MNEDHVKIMQTISSTLDVASERYTDHQLNALDVYGRAISKRAHAILKKRNPVMKKGGLPVEW